MEFVMAMISDTQGSCISYTQESLWLFHQMARPDEPAYNESLAFEEAGKGESGALRSAVQATILRHEALRTRFYEAEDGPRAEVLEAVPDGMAIVDLRASEAGEARARAEELLTDH